MMRQLFLCLGLCLLMTPLLKAQVAVPRGVANELITELKRQGYAYRLQKGYEFLTGIEKKNGPPCESNKALLTQTGRVYNKVLRPQPNTYWVSLKGRREVILAKSYGSGYMVYGRIKIIEQVDPFTYLFFLLKRKEASITNPRSPIRYGVHLKLDPLMDTISPKPTKVAQ